MTTTPAPSCSATASISWWGRPSLRCACLTVPPSPSILLTCSSRSLRASLSAWVGSSSVAAKTVGKYSPTCTRCSSEAVLLARSVALLAAKVASSAKSETRSDLEAPSYRERALSLPPPATGEIKGRNERGEYIRSRPSIVRPLGEDRENEGSAYLVLYVIRSHPHLI